MAQRNTTPKIRFAGFSEDWEERKLGDVAEFNPKSVVPERFEYVDLESVVGTELIGHRKEAKTTAPSRAQRLAKNGDIFYQTVRPYQKNNYLFNLHCDNYVFSTGYAQIRPYIDSLFLFSRLQEERFVKAVLDRCTGTSYPAINSNKLADIDIQFPTENEEQLEIGQLFATLDNLITQHQREHEQTANIKKAMLEKMFPKAGATTPEIRFAEFSGDWEERELFDNISSIIDFRGRTPRKLGLDWSDSGYLALSALNVKDGYIDPSADAHFGDQKLYDKWMSGHELHKGQVLFTTEAPMGNVALVPDDQRYILSQRVIAFNVEPEMITDNFLSTLLRSPRTLNQLLSLSSGGTAKGVSQKSMSELIVWAPKNLDEQKCISDYFSALDRLLSLQQRRLAKLKSIKLALLENMFV